MAFSHTKSRSPWLYCPHSTILGFLLVSSSRMNDKSINHIHLRLLHFCCHEPHFENHLYLRLICHMTHFNKTTTVWVHLKFVFYPECINDKENVVQFFYISLKKNKNNIHPISPRKGNPHIPGWQIFGDSPL